MSGFVDIVPDLSVIAARFSTAGIAGTARAAILDATAHGIGEAGKEMLKAFTPVRTGALKESTDDDVLIDGSGFEVSWRQPATNDAGEEYVQWVVLGHGDVYPVTAKALFIPGVGFRMHAKGAAPNPYPVRAFAAIVPVFDVMLASAADALATSYVTTILE